jgi:hypothetical protein
MANMPNDSFEVAAEFLYIFQSITVIFLTSLDLFRTHRENKEKRPISKFFPIGVLWRQS